MTDCDLEVTRDFVLDFVDGIFLSTQTPEIPVDYTPEIGLPLDYSY